MILDIIVGTPTSNPNETYGLPEEYTEQVRIVWDGKDRESAVIAHNLVCISTAAQESEAFQAACDGMTATILGLFYAGVDVNDYVNVFNSVLGAMIEEYL